MGRLSVLAALALLVGGVSAPSAGSVGAVLPERVPAPLLNAGPMTYYVKLDGRWYASATQPGVATFFLDLTGVRAPLVSMSQCRRSDGQASGFTRWAYYYGPSYFPVYGLRSARLVRQQGPDRRINYLDLETVPGNFICNQEVSPPNLNTPPPPGVGVIFADGFEGIFRSGFER